MLGEELNLKAPTTTVADFKFCDIFLNCREIRLYFLCDLSDLNEMSSLVWFLNSLPPSVICLINLCKHFGPRSGQIKCRAQSGSKLFVTLMVFMKEIFEKVYLEKNQQMTKKACKINQKDKFAFHSDHDHLVSFDCKGYFRVTLHAKLGLYARKLSFWVYEQQRHRPACVSGQNDQCLCYSLAGKYHI